MNVEMKIGDMVRIEKCDKCPTVVGKTARIKCFTSIPSDRDSDEIAMGNPRISESDRDAVELNFGKGRPQVNRPHLFNLDDISLVKE